MGCAEKVNELQRLFPCRVIPIAAHRQRAGRGCCVGGRVGAAGAGGDAWQGGQEEWNVFTDGESDAFSESARHEPALLVSRKSWRIGSLTLVGGSSKSLAAQPPSSPSCSRFLSPVEAAGRPPSAGICSRFVPVTGRFILTSRLVLG